MLTFYCWLLSIAGYFLLLVTCYCWLLSIAGYFELLTFYYWLLPITGYILLLVTFYCWLRSITGIVTISHHLIQNRSYYLVQGHVDDKEDSFGRHSTFSFFFFLVLIATYYFCDKESLFFCGLAGILSFLISSFIDANAGVSYFFWRCCFIQGHLDEKEEEVLLNAVTEGEMRIAYHPDLEQLPPLSLVLEKVEFLSELEPKDRQR